MTNTVLYYKYMYYTVLQYTILYYMICVLYCTEVYCTMLWRIVITHYVTTWVISIFINHHTFTCTCIIVEFLGNLLSLAILVYSEILKTSS